MTTVTLVTKVSIMCVQIKVRDKSLHFEIPVHTIYGGGYVAGYHL